MSTEVNVNQERKFFVIRIWLSILLYGPFVVNAQFVYTIDQSIPVYDKEGNSILMPWAGGLNAAQYNTMDLNADGKEDLVLFDRMANKPITFLNEGDHYHYNPEYESLFPAEATNWVLLRDYNCDGKKDLFTGDILGIKVYTNTTEPGENVSWEKFLFFTGSAGAKSPVLLTKGFTLTNLQIQYDDLPAIVDADGDGDLDIFNFRYAGHGVEFHQNFSIENYGTCDSLDFKRITQNWGNFNECSCGSIALHGEDCPATDGDRVKHAGGKALLALDADGNQQLDLIFSEAACTQLYLLSNTGTLQTPVIDSYSVFPAGHPADFVIFPAAYYEDVDFDGKKDILSTPNIYVKDHQSSNLAHSNWFYKNTGTAENPVFTFTQTDFLQEQMIDVGDNAVPAFADYDGDGDYDMFISRNSAGNFASTIFLYENNGSIGDPSFRLLTEDYLLFSDSPFYNLKIQFADMNGDNAPDLVYTATRFDTGTTGLYFLSNKSQNTLDFSGRSAMAVDFDMTYSENLYITNVDEDGKPDILAGRSSGALEYWRNTGTPSSPAFTLENGSFLGISSSGVSQNIACAVADLDADGKADIVYSDQSGKLKIISDYHHAPEATPPLAGIVLNSLTGENTDPNLGGRTWPVAVNLFNTTKPALVAGNVLGGIHILKNDEGEPLPKDPVIHLYPNPLKTTETLNLKIDRPAYVQVLSVLGQRLGTSFRLQPGEIYQYQLPSLAAGLYLLQFNVNHKSYTKRIVIR